MTNYPVKLSHRARLTPDGILATACDAFGSGARDGEVVSASFGALTRLTARVAGKELAVETTMDPKVSVDVAAETVRRYNRFLEGATGFNSKERAKRLRKSGASSGRGA